MHDQTITDLPVQHIWVNAAFHSANLAAFISRIWKHETGIIKNWIDGIIANEKGELSLVKYSFSYQGAVLSASPQ